MIFADLQMVLDGNPFGIAEPRADNVRRKPLSQFRLPRAAHVVEEQPTWF
jgi:hypothetical protein